MFQFFITCPRCATSNGGRGTEQEALVGWNRRADALVGAAPLSDDTSPGDVIDASADGTIVLDDGPTTHSWPRACAFLYESNRVNSMAWAKEKVRADGLACKLANLAAPPSAERILTQARDVEAAVKACAREIADKILADTKEDGDACWGSGVWALILRKHFGASRGGAAVVTRDAVIDECIAALWVRTGREEYGHAKAAVTLDIEALQSLKSETQSENEGV